MASRAGFLLASLFSALILAGNAAANDAATESWRAKFRAENGAAAAQADEEEPVEIKAEPLEDPVPFMFGLFDARKPKLEPLTEEQAEFDEKWQALAKSRNYEIKEEFAPTTVSLSGYAPGSIVIDTKNKYLYFVESPTTAIRYGIAVGREGLAFAGKTTVGNKKVWPTWTPTKQMIEREPHSYKRYADGMDGGLNNPLGARAIYLHQGRNDTYLRIHGTNRPETIGTASSNGCFRMHNENVIDLYQRVKLGAEVIIL